MSRGHTIGAPTDHVASGGKAWDTVKPLHMWFSDLSKVILVDDDAFKVPPVVQLWVHACMCNSNLLCCCDILCCCQWTVSISDSLQQNR